MFIVLLRCLIMYGVVILAVRLMGKRQIGELQPAELVITILISELASMPIQDPRLPVVSAVMPILALVALEITISLCALKSVRIRTTLYGRPLILIYQGKFRQKQMEKARVTIDDIMEIMRNNGITNIKDVDYAILETNGQLNVIKKEETVLSLPTGIKGAGLPHVIIMDGAVQKNNLKESGLNMRWLYRQLKDRDIDSIKDVFLLTADDRNNVYLVKKQ